MRKIRAFSMILLTALAAGAVQGCVGLEERIRSVQRGSGVVRIFDKPLPVTFSAALRTLHRNNVPIREAQVENGRIVGFTPLTTIGVFLTSLGPDRTKMEVVTRFLTGDLTSLSFPGGTDAFFAQLAEQTVVFEKAENAKREERRLERERRGRAAAAFGAAPGNPARPRAPYSGRRRRGFPRRFRGRLP